MPDFLSTKSLFRRYASESPSRPGWARGLRFCLRARLQGQLHRQWFGLIDRPQLAVARAAGTGLCARLQHPYVCARLTRVQRFNLLRKHFELLCRFPEPVRNGIYSREGLIIAKFEEGGIEHVVRLIHQAGTHREGDMSLAWDCSLGRVAMATFALVNSRLGKRAMVVGGLQGSNSGDSHALYQMLTRTMHGLRPMSALVHFLQLAAGHLGVELLLGVEDDAHALYRPGERDRAKKTLSYDAIWSEHGGEYWKLGLYRLPVQVAPRDLATVASKKRSMYRKRYAMLDGLDVAMRESLQWACQLPGPRVEADPELPSGLWDFHPGDIETVDAFA